MSEPIADACVLSELLPTAEAGQFIGHISLNAPRTLNALNLEIILSLREILGSWEKDPRIAAVFIDGKGEKAFCAGGDVKRIHAFISQARAAGQDPGPLCQVFFENEYRLDYAIHVYPKPLIVWGDGIVMGGGIGVMAGASHRVVTETTMLAMPEISIGLYPDVAASYFLPRMPGRIGLFLGLTAARFQAGDALFVGLADHFVPRGAKDSLLAQLRATRFEAPSSAEQVTKALLAVGSEAPASILKQRQSEIDAWTAGADVEGIVARFKALDPAVEDSFLTAARQSLLSGSPTSLKLTFEQYQRSKGISLKAAFEQELVLSLQCCLHHDFAEGVRALLIDRDNAPNWSPRAIKDVSSKQVEQHFAAPWSGSHPLADL